MKLKSVKAAAELPIKGVEFTVVDGNITEVVVGGKVRIQRGSDYPPCLRVLVEARETARRHRVVARAEGFPDSLEYHDTRAEASARKEWYEEKMGSVVTVDLDEVEVVLAEDGNVIGPAAPAAGAAVAEMPF